MIDSHLLPSTFEFTKRFEECGCVHYSLLNFNSFLPLNTFPDCLETLKKNYKRLTAAFLNVFCTNPGNESALRKRRIPLSVFKSFQKIQKLLALCG
jgi:hypothetical protein